MAAAHFPADSRQARPTGAPWRRLVAILVAAQCLTLLLLGTMLLNKQRSLLTELTLSRIEIQAGDLAGALRTGILTGLRPDEIHNLAGMVARLKAADDGIAAIDIVAADAGGARIAFADDAARVGASLPGPAWQAIRAARGFQHSARQDEAELAVAVIDAGDEVVAGLRLRAKAAPLAQAAAAMASALWHDVAWALAVLVGTTVAALAWLGRSGYRGGALRRRVMAVALVTTLAAGSQIAWYGRGLFSTGLAPAVTAKVQGVAGFLAGKFQRAETLGIPLDKLPGLTEYFAGIIVQHPEVAALRLTDGGGRVLAAAGSAAGPWLTRAAGPAQVAAAVDAGFVARRLDELAADIGIVSLVAALVFRELLAALLGGMPDSRGATVAGRLQSLRLPLFLFILTEEMSRSFLPLYIKVFTAAGGPLAPETAVGMPIAVYMLAFALATPFAGRWADRWGVGRAFAAGVVLSLLGFVWMALASDYWQLLPARALCAWGYATGSMACQRQLIVLTGPAERARGLALFVGAVGIAAICGSALGGVLADQIGFRPVFGVSALLALLALAVFRLTQGDAGAPREAGPPLRWSEVRRLLADRRFAALMLGGAIPAKIALAGFLFYLTPLALHRLAYSPAAIGRAVMLYFILVAAINPLASWLSDRYGWRLSLTVLGGALIGMGSLTGGLGGAIGDEQAVWIAIAALGIGTGLATAPMQALASEIGAGAGATSVAVVLRTLERLGSVIGPLWAGAWLAGGGWHGAMTAVGTIVLAGTALCLAAATRRDSP